MILDWLIYLVVGSRCHFCGDRYRDAVKLEAHVLIDHAADRS